MKKLFGLIIFLFIVMLSGQSYCFANCDFFQNNSPTPTCNAMNNMKMWCDTTAPGSATAPVLKVCDGVSSSWNQAELTTRTLNTTFNGTVTNAGAVTNSSTVTNNGAVTSTSTVTISGALDLTGTYNPISFITDGDNTVLKLINVMLLTEALLLLMIRL